MQHHPLTDLNQMDQTQFVSVLGEVFEHTPEIAAQTWQQRPFATVADLHRAMVEVMYSFSEAAQLALIQAHPDLGSKTKMAEASVQEQTGAGLTQLTPTEFDRFQFLNAAYRQKFGFPFIIAVRHHTKASILDAFEQRLTHSVEVETQQSLAEIAEIARFRLIDRIGDPAIDRA